MTRFFFFGGVLVFSFWNFEIIEGDIYYWSPVRSLNYFFNFVRIDLVPHLQVLVYFLYTLSLIFCFIGWRIRTNSFMAAFWGYINYEIIYEVYGFRNSDASLLIVLFFCSFIDWSKSLCDKRNEKFLSLIRVTSCIPFFFAGLSKARFILFDSNYGEILRSNLLLSQLANLHRQPYGFQIFFNEFLLGFSNTTLGLFWILVILFEVSLPFMLFFRNTRYFALLGVIVFMTLVHVGLFVWFLNALPAFIFWCNFDSIKIFHKNRHSASIEK